MNYDETRSGGEWRGRPMHGYPNYYVGDDFEKVAIKKEMKAKGYTEFLCKDNPDDPKSPLKRKYKIKIKKKDLKLELKVQVLYRNEQNYADVADRLKKSGQVPAPDACTVWVDDPELTAMFLAQCDYQKPKEVTIELLPGGKFECRAVYIMGGKEFKVRLDEIERKPSNIKLDPATYRNAIVAQLTPISGGVQDEPSAAPRKAHR